MPIKVLVAKPGLDGHETGAKLIARVLRDAGMEVIYTGPRQTPEMIVQAALHEDIDVIGLSSLSGAHLELAMRVMELLHDHGMRDVMVIMGGIIPADDIPVLEQIGVRATFGPGTNTQDIVDFIRKEHAAA